MDGDVITNLAKQEPTTVVGQRDDLFINTHDGVTFVYADDTGAGSPGWIRAGGSASLSIALKGSVANAAALPNGAAAGDVYITLDDDQGNVSDGQGNWAKVGPIRGPRGDQVCWSAWAGCRGGDHAAGADSEPLGTATISTAEQTARQAESAATIAATDAQTAAQQAQTATNAVSGHGPASCPGAADTALGAADTALGARIDTEETARQQGDAALDTRDAVEARFHRRGHGTVAAHRATRRRRPAGAQAADTKATNILAALGPLQQTVAGHTTDIAALQAGGGGTGTGTGGTGATGPAGPKGDPGTDGTDGTDGVGVSAANVSSGGDLTLTLTDGNTLGPYHVKGADGATGPAGTDGTSVTDIVQGDASPATGGIPVGHIAVKLTDAAGADTWHDAGAIPGLPASAIADDGKILTVANGVPSWQDRVSDLPNTAGQNAGDALTITDPAQGTVGWTPAAAPSPPVEVKTAAEYAALTTDPGTIYYVTA